MGPRGKRREFKELQEAVAEARELHGVAEEHGDAHGQASRGGQRVVHRIAQQDVPRAKFEAFPLCFGAKTGWIDTSGSSREEFRRFRVCSKAPTHLLTKGEESEAHHESVLDGGGTETKQGDLRLLSFEVVAL